jgi:hypothetical protein
LKYRRTRAEQKALLVEAGYEFFKDGERKHRYVGIYGDRRIKRILKRALRWEVLPYPKRVTNAEMAAATQPQLVDSPVPPIPSSRPPEDSHLGA